MDKFKDYLTQFDITSGITDEDIENTVCLLQLYAPILRRASHSIGEMEAECFEARRQSVTDFVNLAIDYDHDNDRKRIAERLTSMGHSMGLLSIMEDALVLMKDDTSCSGTCYDILKTRYFDAYCKSNEDAYLTLGISSSTYYRNIRKAIRLYAAELWCVVIPDLILREQTGERQSGSQMGVIPAGKREEFGSRVKLS